MMEDLREKGLRREVAQNHAEWRLLILLLYSNYLLCFRLDQLWLGDFYISLIPAYNTRYCHFLSGSR